MTVENTSPANNAPGANPGQFTSPDPPNPAPSTARRPFRRGEICGVCGLGVLDFNGLLDLECPVCGYTEGPGGGCT